MCHCSSLYKPKKTPFVLLGALFSLVRKTQFCCFRCVVPNFVVLGVCSSLFKIPKNCLLKKKKISPIFSFWVCHSCFFKNPMFFVLGALFFLVQEPKKMLQNSPILCLEHCISSLFQNRKIVVLDALFFLVQKPPQFFLLFWMCLSWV